VFRRFFVIILLFLAAALFLLRPAGYKHAIATADVVGGIQLENAAEIGNQMQSRKTGRRQTQAPSRQREAPPSGFVSLVSLHGVEDLTPLKNSYGLLPLSRSDFRTFMDQNGIERRYRPEVVLAKFKSDPAVYALKVKSGGEIEVQKALSAAPDVEFAELDLVMTRQFDPNDQELSKQWHHATIQSMDAWSVSLGNSSVTVAMLDTPFQMDHPDLATHAITGWDMVSSNAITTQVFRDLFSNATYVYHSTIGGGLACAGINNFIGVAGVANCQLMPINIGDAPTLSDMYKAVIWAADHDVRIVNLSWDGAYSSVLNDGAGYLKQKTRGMLFMAGVNGANKFLDYSNQPNIYAISMTDASDTARSAYGPHIDFAAPGYNIYSTTTNSGYELDIGSSYSCPLAAGLAAFVMSVNPSLGPEEIFSLMQASAVDLGSPGWDQHFGWGRPDFGKLALAAFATLPVSHISASDQNAFTIQAQYVPGVEYQLFRSSTLSPPDWQAVSQFSMTTNNSILSFQDLSPVAMQNYYQLKIHLP
jgi:subtilisin family serine protease